MVCDVASIVIGTFEPIDCNPSLANISVVLFAEMYTPVLGQSPLIDTLFLRLRKKVAMELRFQQDLVKVKGALDMLLATASLSSVA